MSAVSATPAGWRVSSVGGEFQIQLGKMLDAARNVGVWKPYVGNRAVQWGRVDTSAIGYARLTTADLKKFRLRRGDLLVCEGGEIGRAAIWDALEVECYYQKALHRLRPRHGYEPQLMQSFFEYWASTGYLANFVTQTSIAHLAKDKLETVPLPIPPLRERKAIVAALSAADDAIAALDRLIAKKRDIKIAAMQQLLTGRTRLPGFSASWTDVVLGNIGATYGGLSGKSASDFGSGDARFVPFLNVLQNTRVDMNALAAVRVGPAEKQNRVASGDLLFNGTSETPGELAMGAVVVDAAPNLFLNSFCFGFRLFDQSQYSGLFLAYLFRGSPGRGLLRALAQGATRYNLSKAQFKRLAVTAPEFAEQQAIAAVLDDMDAEISALELRRDKAQAIKRGMMQALLTGRVRLEGETSSA